MTPEDAPTQPTITVTTGPAAGRSVEIEGQLVIGREGADLTIADDAELSRRHAVLRATAAGVVIEDLGSLNGTFVNDQRISTATAITPDDAIRVGLSRLKLVLPAPPAPDPTPIVDIESTRQRPILDIETTRQRPIVDVETTRQRPVVDVETTRQRPVVDVETTRQRPIVDVETTRQRPIVDVETTRQRPIPDAAPSEDGSPPAPGGSRGLPSTVVTVIAVVAILAAIGIALASNLTSSKSTHQFSATITASPQTTPQQGQVELAGSQQGGLLGPGAVTIDQFLSTTGPSGATSALLSARITADLPAGRLVSVVKAAVTPRPGGGRTIAGTGTITGGTSRYKHATGSYSITAAQASAGGATIFTLRGSISY
jgi:hypothetical protein